MGKALLGIILLIAGALLAVGGALTAVAFGPSGTLQSASTPLKTDPDGYALVADVVAVSAGFPGSALLGTPTLGADSTGTERLFVGIGSRADVDEYLAGASFEAVRQDGSAWQSLSIPGVKKPGVPTDESFWIRRATGNEPTVDFATSNGNATFVIMRADGTPDVRAQILIGYTSRWVFPLALAALVIGVLLAIEGIVLLVRSRRGGRPAAGGDADARESGDEAAHTQQPAATESTSEPTEQSDPADTTTVLPATDPPADSGDKMPDEWFRGPEQPS